MYNINVRGKGDNMKKVKIGALLLWLMATLSLSACGNNYADSVDVSTTVSYDTLEMMAVEPSYIPNNYSVTTSNFNYDSSITFINCYDSLLGYDSNGYLKNIETGNTISSYAPSNYLRSYNSYFNSSNNYIYSSSYPIVMFTTYTNNNSKLCIVDSSGNYLYSNSFGNYYYIENVDSKRINGTLYFSLYITSASSKEFYFRYDVTNEVRTVVEISAEEFNNASTTSSSTSNLPSNYYDGLIPVYSKNKTTIGYYINKNNLLNIYDENKNFLNSINPSSFGMDNNGTRIGNYLFFYKNVEYYSNELDKGSEKKYKNKCLVVDLTNGKVSYNDDFKYYISNVTKKSDNEITRTKYVVVKYYELKEDRTLSNILMCSIMTEELDFSNSYAYDGLINSVTKIADGYLVVDVDSSYYLVSKKDRTLMYGLTDFVFFTDGKILYKNSQDNLYYYVSSSELVSKYKEIGTGFGYVSTNKFEGKIIGCKYDTLTSKYTYGSSNVKSDYLSYITSGIIVCEKDVYVVNQKVSNNNSDVKVLSVNYILNRTDSKIISINYDDGSSQYVKLTYNLIS